jgi:hypothetical protein
MQKYIKKDSMLKYTFVAGMGGFTEESAKFADRFNSGVKKLGRIYLIKKKGAFDEQKAYRTQKRSHWVMNMWPLFIMELVGPIYLKYADLVKDRNFDKFLEMDFAAEKEAYQNVPDGKDKSEEQMNEHIDCFKLIWKNASESEKKAISEIAIDLLSTYCEYAIFVKENGEGGDAEDDAEDE